MLDHLGMTKIYYLPHENKTVVDVLMRNWRRAHHYKEASVSNLGWDDYKKIIIFKCYF